MQQNIDNIKFITGNAEVLKNISKVPVHRMLDERVIEFLGALSSRILKDKRTKEYPDVISYAFWIRKSSLMKMKKEYSSPYQRIGRGVALHIAPSNVPVNFAVSFTSALLAGNASVVRVSNKEFVQVDIIADAINALYQEEYADMEKYLVLIRYEHSEEITQIFVIFALYGEEARHLILFVKQNFLQGQLRWHFQIVIPLLLLMQMNI